MADSGKKTPDEPTHKVWQAPDRLCYVRSINFEPPEGWEEKYKGSKDECDNFVVDCKNNCANCNREPIEPEKPADQETAA